MLKVALPQKSNSAHLIHTGLQPGAPQAINDQKTVSTVFLGLVVR